MLLEQVWGYRHAADTRLVNVHVQRLRAKIEPDPERPEIILTVRGVGYKAGTGLTRRHERTAASAARVRSLGRPPCRPERAPQALAGSCRGRRGGLPLLAARGRTLAPAAALLAPVHQRDRRRRRC